MEMTESHRVGFGILLGHTSDIFKSRVPLFVGIWAVTATLSYVAFALGLEVWRRLILGVGSKLGAVVVFGAALGFVFAGQCATALATSELHLGRTINIQTALSGVHKRNFRLFVLMCFLQVVPIVGPLIGAFALTAVPTAVLEDLKAVAALKRNAILMKGSYRRVIFAYLLWLLLNVLLMFLLAGTIPARLWTYWGSFILSIFAMITYFTLLVFMVFLTLNYHEQLAREERVIRHA